MALFPERLGKLSFLPIFLMLIFISCGATLIWYFWQDNEVDQLRVDVSQGNQAEAAKRVETLEKLALEKREVQRLKAMGVRENDPNQALAILSPLLTSPESSDYNELVLTYIRIAMEAELFEQAKQALNKHNPNLNHIPDYLYWQAKYYVSQNQVADAIYVLDRLLSIDSEHGYGRLLRAEILLSLESFASWVQAKVNLRIASKDFGPAGKEATLLLATQPKIPLFDNDRAWLVRQLRNHANKDPNFGILASSNELLLEPGKREKIVNSTVKAYGAKAPDLVAAWLLNVGALNELQNFIENGPGRKLNSEKVLQYSLQVALENQEYEDAKKLLLQLDQKNGLSKLRRATLLTAIELNQVSAPPTAPTELWIESQQLALEAKDATSLATLARLAARFKWWQSATDTYTAALETTNIPTNRAQLLQDKFQVDLYNKNTREAYNDAVLFLNIYPEHSVMLNNAFYLQALLNDEGLNQMAYPSDKMTDELDGFVWATYAFAMWRSGDFKAAEIALSKLPEKFAKLPSCQLVALLVALENNEIETARALSLEIPVEALLPEEQLLLEQAQQKIRS